jgi:hypothetical protein
LLTKTYILSEVFILYVLALLLHFLIHLEENALAKLLDLHIETFLDIVHDRIYVEDLVDPSFHFNVCLCFATLDIFNFVIIQLLLLSSLLVLQSVDLRFNFLLPCLFRRNFVEGVPYFSYKPTVLSLDAFLLRVDVVTAVFFKLADLASVELIFLLEFLDVTLALAINEHEFLTDSLLEVVFFFDELVEVENVLVLHQFLFGQEQLVFIGDFPSVVTEHDSDLLLHHCVFLDPSHLDDEHYVLVI